MHDLRVGQGIQVLHEDREILVIEKPQGLLSIADGNGRGKNAFELINRALSQRGDKTRIALVHRLDRDTSGVMIFAKSASVKKKLMSNWNEMVNERLYCAVVEGDIPLKEGLIDAPLKEDRNGHVRVDAKGLTALTHWRVLEEGPLYTLLELSLETGRKNQIRAHMAELNRPIAGDIKYGAASDPLKRLALHASKISIIHPGNSRLCSWEVPPPPSFLALVRQK